MSIKSKNALVQRLLPSVPGQQLLTVIECSWSEKNSATGLLYLTDRQLGFMPKKERQQTTLFPRERLIGYDFHEGKMMAKLILHFAGPPSAELSSIFDEETGTFVRWLDGFVNREAAQYGTEHLYGAYPDPTAAPPDPQFGPPQFGPQPGPAGPGFPHYSDNPYRPQPGPDQQSGGQWLR